ncbi:dihydrodipicolinate synthase family protein [Saccharopolyspora hattusasensis]|uniref:dihydrodipicolinate synthase family protein n=1 Tax=Saccharopolyspora hattusasensis TaxID=1128679 RepID=UPI003D96BDF4
MPGRPTGHPGNETRTHSRAVVGARGARRWTEQAAEAGTPAVMLLPPNAYRADRHAIVEHYRIVSKAGLPIVAYNNPHDTKIDLTPDLLAERHGEGLIVSVKEFSGDVRRYYQITELAPELDVLCGTDDVALELAIAGSPGWISGYPNALPQASARLWKAASEGDLETALPLYRSLHPLLRWDSRTEFVQAIKLSMSQRARGPLRTASHRACPPAGRARLRTRRHQPRDSRRTAGHPGVDTVNNPALGLFDWHGRPDRARGSCSPRCAHRGFDFQSG